MKTILLIAGLLITQATYAATIADIKKDISEINIKEGELRDLNDVGDCSLTFEEKNNQSYIVISTDQVQLSVMILKKDKIQVSVRDEDDGSFSQTYKFGYASSLEITHVDDAYEEATLSTGATTLTCGVYY